MKYATLLPMICAAMVLAGCAKEQDDPAPPSDGGSGGGGTDPSSITIDSDPVVLMRVDGNEVLIPIGANVTLIMGNDIVPGDPSMGAWTCGLYNSVVDLVLFEMRIGSLTFPGDLPTQEDFVDFLAPGPRGYGYAFGGTQGVSLEWYDSEFNPWRSHCGSADQTASDFTITDVVEQGDVVKLRATFACKLYRCLGGDDERTVTDGVLVLTFRKD